MNAHTLERAFLWAGGITLIVFLGALAYSTVALGIQLPGADDRVDPSMARSEAPFATPGVFEREDGSVELVVVAQAWAFTPEEIRIPAGVDVTITGTSVDVLHGLHIEDTRVNMMLIPGQVSRNRYRFDTPGEYLLVCHEYCGYGHHIMSARVIVE